MSELPPLPAGFVLDAPQSAVPPLPSGFMLDAAPAQSNPVMDFLKSLPHGLMRGVSGTLSATGAAANAEMSQPGVNPSPQEAQQALEQITGPTHAPEGRAGRFGAAIGEGLGNPLTYLGPGGIPLKVGGSILSSIGGEAGGQVAEGTPYEGAARVGGGLAGGAAAVKTLGPKALTAAAPTSAELRAAKDTGYQAARDADVVLDPRGPASWAAQTERELTNGPKYAFTGGSNGTASKTLEALADAQAIPSVAGSRATVTGANLDTLRIRLNNIAGETHEFKPTPDAKAAMVAKRRLQEYTENIPSDHVLAGDAIAYGRETKIANANNAAFERTRGVEQKLTNATDATEGGIATKIDNQIKSKLRNGYLTNEKKQRGLTQDEVGAIRDTNRGSITERALRQVGRLAPEGPMNLALHIGTGLGAAAATGGMSVPIQIAGALAASVAKHTAQRMTTNNAERLVEMLAKRSPEYQKRAALTNLHNSLMDKTPNKAAIIRALLIAH